MPKLKYYKPGKPVNVWILDRQFETHSLIDNFSNFVQICIDIAPDIMAWAILNDADPKTYDTHRKLEEVLDKYNEKYPLDPLTAKRLGKNGSNTKTPNRRAHKESNPALL